MLAASHQSRFQVTRSDRAEPRPAFAPPSQGGLYASVGFAGFCLEERSHSPPSALGFRSSTTKVVAGGAALRPDLRAARGALCPQPNSSPQHFGAKFSRT